MIVEHITAGLSAYIASITDMKNRKIPNVLSVGMIATGALYGFLKGVFFETMLIMILTYSVFFIFQFSKAWGGGDSKLITGISGIYGTYKINADFYFLYFYFIILIIVIFFYLAGCFIIKVINKTPDVAKATVPVAPAIYIAWLFSFIIDLAVLK